MGSKTYDAMKWTALVLLPALATLYFAVGQIWNFPAVEQVVGTITAIDTFLGLLVKQSAKNYGTNKPVGTLIVMQDHDGSASGIRLVGEQDPLILDTQKVATFDVKREYQQE